ncbi:MAG: glycosyltransferase [Deltaproteobacteria bacterium]|nr:glycosyltransferase [Deltaproteobacteria bacterium]MBW2144767.1 glycosyltransferase [Deltaproteobacteria bacterium]
MNLSSISAVSVIIPEHNGGLNFRRCLQSLDDSDLPPEETIVVADGDTDGSWRVAEEFGAQVLKTSEPRGPARARNLGAHVSKGEILFFIDADVTVPQDAITLVTNAFQCDPELAALFGSYDEAPFQTNFLSQYKNLFHHYVHQTANEEAFTFWGACGAVRREVFLATGGFDEGYRYPSVEDIEFGYRLKRSGYRIRLVKDLQVRHLKRWGVFSLLKADFFYRALPWTRLILKKGGFIDDLNLRLSARISVVCVYAFVLSLCAVPFSPLLFVPAVIFAVMLFILNWDLYRFFKNRRGLGFVLKTIPWHWLYFLYSGLAFAVGLAEYQIRKIMP